MTTMIGLFSAIGEHIPIFKDEKLVEASAEGTVNRFHYRATCLLILTCCLMVTCTEWISGTGSIIDCMHGGTIPDNVINMFCYIQGTFSVPIHWRDHDTEIGYDVSQTGVGPYNPNVDFIETKQYYQWVPFVLFLQGIMFYIPHVIYKMFEGRKVRTIMGSLNIFVLKNEDRVSQEEELAEYFIETRGIHDTWALGLLFAHSLYLINVIGQIFFTDMFLGYEFSTFGVDAASFLEQEPEGRTDPMSRVFPRVTKCTFHKYGSSGSLMRLDAQCVLPINIVNEKIYVFLWFWFLVLAILTILDLIHHLGLVMVPSVREMILKRKLRTAPTFKVVRMDIDVKLIMANISFGDWKLFYHLIRNMDSVTAAEWMQALTKKLRRELESKAHDSETLPLKTKLSLEKEM